MSHLMLFSCAIALLHIVSGQKNCNVPILDQKPCGGLAGPSDQSYCENNLGCCFIPAQPNAYARCHQTAGEASGSTNYNPYVQRYQFPPQAPQQVARSPPVSSHWQPTSLPYANNSPFRNYLQAGGEPGYEGSKLLQTCNPNRRWNRCLKNYFGFIPQYSCKRLGCCFDFRSKICYKSTYHITKLRNKCPPGFKNPPKCTDIDECQSNPCKNGGFCQNLINSFKCNCLEPTRGETCTEVCRDPPVPEFGSISDDPNRPYDIDELVTFICDGTRELVGEQSTTCTDAGTWSNLAPTCKIVCRDPPVPSGGSIANDRTGPYDIDESVNFICDGTLEFEGTTCTATGMWSNPAPTCKIVCRDPPVPENGSIDDTRTGPFDIGEMVTFSCDGTRKLIGPEDSTCTVDETWSNPVPPECVPECSVALYDFPSTAHLDAVQYNDNVPSMAQGTACMWVNVGSHSRDFGLVSYATSSIDNDFLIFVRSATTLRLDVGNQQTNLDTDLPLNTWTHLCVTFDATAMSAEKKVYVNGVFKDSGTYPAAGITGGGILVLGQDQDSRGGGFSSSQSFSGSIENFIMWNRVLDENEISNVASKCACPDDFIIAMTLDNTTSGSGISTSTPATCRTLP